MSIKTTEKNKVLPTKKTGKPQNFQRKTNLERKKIFDYRSTTNPILTSQLVNFLLDRESLSDFFLNLLNSRKGIKDTVIL